VNTPGGIVKLRPVVADDSRSHTPEFPTLPRGNAKHFNAKSRNIENTKIFCDNVSCFRPFVLYYGLNAPRVEAALVARRSC
jgi:hypothetical protein